MALYFFLIYITFFHVNNLYSWNKRSVAFQNVSNSQHSLHGKRYVGNQLSECAAHAAGFSKQSYTLSKWFVTYANSKTCIINSSAPLMRNSWTKCRRIRSDLCRDSFVDFNWCNFCSASVKCTIPLCKCAVRIVWRKVHKWWTISEMWSGGQWSNGFLSH